jgi:hypothetical protein
MARKPLKQEIKPVKPHLTRGTGGVAAEVMDVRKDLERCMDRIETEFPLIDQETRRDLWIDGANGDDANDGSSLALAVKSVLRLRELIPAEIQTNYFIIHVRGPLALTAANNAPLHFNTRAGMTAAGAPADPLIIIQGDISSRGVHLDDGAGGNIVSDINAAGQIGLSTATWTEGEHRAYWCEIKTGVLAGQTFIVDKNDGTTLTLMNCPLDPGAGAEFVLTNPLTEVSAGPFWMGQQQVLTTILNGPGRLYVTALHFTGGATFGINNAQNLGTSNSLCTACIVKGDGLIFTYVMLGGGGLALGSTLWDLSTDVPTIILTGTVGVSVNAYPPVGAIYIYCESVVQHYFCMIPDVGIWHCNCNFQWWLSSIHRTTLLCTKVPGHGGTSFGALFTGFGPPGVPTRFGGYRAFGVPVPVAPAIEMYDSEADFQSSQIVDSTMALRMVNSKAVVHLASGADHTVCGVHADANSSVFLPPDTLPTLAGNSGTVELSEDGSSEKSKWSAIGGLRATGTITCVAQANLVDNDNFTIDDGVNPALTFEYQVTGGFTPTGGGVLVIDVQAAVTDVDVAVATQAALDAATLDITAPVPTTAVIALTNDLRGVVGNVAITELVADAGFLVTGMASGADGVPVSTPECVCKEYSPSFAFSFPG